MPVVTFAATGAGNCVVVDGAPFVYARTRLGECVMSALCPHRGGPLHLASLDDQRQQLICPWHGSRIRLSWALRRAVPAVRRGNVVTAVFPHSADLSEPAEYRPLSRDLGGVHRGDAT